MHALVRRDEPDRLIDTLLISALIEARSCERFQILADGLDEDPELAALYRSLLACEAKHHGIYLDLAMELATREAVDARWLNWLRPRRRLSLSHVNGCVYMPVSRVDESAVQRVRVGADEFVWIDASASEEVSAIALPLVLVHGFTGHRDDFIEIVPELARKRRVLAPDLRGHGNSVGTPGAYGFGFEQMVKDLVEWLDALEIERCDLFGHSMGGMLTLRFALAHPDRIRSLTFMCTAPELPASLSRKGFEIGAEIAADRGMAGLQVLMEKASRENCSDTIANWGERYWTHHRRRLCAMTPESFCWGRAGILRFGVVGQSVVRN